MVCEGAERPVRLPLKPIGLIDLSYALENSSQHLRRLGIGNSLVCCRGLIAKTGV